MDIKKEYRIHPRDVFYIFVFYIAVQSFILEAGNAFPSKYLTPLVSLAVSETKSK